MNATLVRVEADPIRQRTDLIVTEIFALLAGFILSAVLPGGYNAGFTPRQRLERQVRTGLRRNEFYVEYQAIVGTCKPANGLVQKRYCAGGIRVWA